MVIVSKFSGRCTACGGSVVVGEQVNWIKGVQGVTHTNTAKCAQQIMQPKAAPAPAVTANAKPVADFLGAARERGVKWPKVAFLGPNGSELTMKLAGVDSKNPGAVFVMVNGEYSGSVAVDGTVRGALANRADVLATLEAVTADPAVAAKAYGALKGNCSFCNATLTDDRTGSSLEYGYGPKCAKNYGLPHAPKAKRLVKLKVAA